MGPRIGSLLALVLALLAGDPCGQARAADGDGEGFGPVIGFSNARSWSLGWELSITRGGPWAKGSLGGAYHIAPRGDDPYTIHYVAFEPWLLVGGTLGVALADGPETARFAYGVWEGFPFGLDGRDPFGGKNVAGEGERGLMLTITIGWRGFGSSSQIYITPKLWHFAPIGFNS